MKMVIAAAVGIIIATSATGQEYDYERCASIGRSTGEFKEYMWCLDRLDARDTGKKYWRTPTPNDPTYKKFTAEDIARARVKQNADRPRQLASQVSTAREKYEEARHHFINLVNNGGAAHWDNEARMWTWYAGDLMVENYEKWEQAVNEERDFRESAGLDNPQYERNSRNLEKAKRTYTEILDKARDQARDAGYID